MDNFSGSNNNSNCNNENINEDENTRITKMLLNLSQKTNVFVDDQTPTPTCLIKNCEEVGLFEDLCHVNPFEETFRKACEQCSLQNAANHSTLLKTIKTAGVSAMGVAVPTDDETSLHTPQVFPQFDVASEVGLCESDCGSRDDDLVKHSLDVATTVLEAATSGTSVEASSIANSLIKAPNYLEQTSNNNDNCKTSVATSNALDKAFSKLTPAIQPNTVTKTATMTSTSINFLPSALQFIHQPQVITLTFPTATIHQEQQQQKQCQEVSTACKPLLLPKLSNSQMNNSMSNCNISSKNSKLLNNKTITTTTTLPVHNNSINNNNEPSSASLTPTSQLPIKERLKAILNQNIKCNLQEWPENNNSNGNNNNTKIDTMERRRAASSRYRHKIRMEYKELKKQNLELQLENGNLKNRIKNLETELIKLQTIASNNKRSDNNCEQNLSTQLQIPASTIHLVMNLPKMMIPLNNQYGGL